MEKVEYKGISGLEVKKEGEALYVSGYAAVYGNEDSYGDVILPGAFARFLSKAEDVARLRLLAQHRIENVIGVIEEIRSDEKGLFFKAKLLPTTLGKDYAILLETGGINEFSIGYRSVDSEWNADGQRLLKEIYLYEISAVTRAANDQAVVTGTERKNEQPGNVADMTDKELEEEIAKNAARAQDLNNEFAKRVLEKIQL